MKKNFYDKDLGWNKLVTEFKAGEDAAVFIGVQRSSGEYKAKTGKGKASKEQSITIAQIAAIHEFGSSDGRIPERSFMSSALKMNESKLGKFIDKVVGNALDGEYDEYKALGLVGEFVKGLMQKRIRQGVPPPNAPSTIAAKGSSKPLIDTGQLINSIEWQIVSKDKK